MATALSNRTIPTILVVITVLISSAMSPLFMRAALAAESFGFPVQQAAVSQLQAAAMPPELISPPLQRDMQFEYELSLIADYLRRGAVVDEQAYAKERIKRVGAVPSAYFTFMGEYHPDATLKSITVYNEQGEAIEGYAVIQQDNSTLITLVRSDGASITLSLDANTLIAKTTSAQGALLAATSTQIGPLVAFMGYQLEDSVN